MNGAENDYSVLPTEYDVQQLQSISGSDGRVEAENRTWVALYYTATPEKQKRWNWCPWSLIVNCPGLPARPAPYEFKNLSLMLTFMRQLESERKREGGVA